MLVDIGPQYFYLLYIFQKVNNNFEEKKNLKLPKRKSWISDENIEIYEYFIKNDISSLEHINFLSGEPPTISIELDMCLFENS